MDLWGNEFIGGVGKCTFGMVRNEKSPGIVIPKTAMVFFFAGNGQMHSLGFVGKCIYLDLWGNAFLGFCGQMH